MTEYSKIRLRAADDGDFDFAWTIYRTSMEPLTEELLDWHEQDQRNVVKKALQASGSSVITVEEDSVGWLQVCESADNIYLAQLYVQTDSQNQGIGSFIVRHLCDRARRRGKSLTLDIMTNNSARRLNERLGFRPIGRSKYKIEMQWFDDE